MSNELIRLGQEHSNNFVENKIVVDGLRGIETQRQGVRLVQHAMNLDYGADLEVDGIWGSASNTTFSSHNVREGETQYMVTALEILLLLKGYDPGGGSDRRPGSIPSPDGCRGPACYRCDRSAKLRTR